ncbi:MAG TPA: SPOR domain-containing protein [Ilumatobacteraceae bacterium]
MKTKLFLAGAVSLALITTACGSSSKKSAPTTTTTTTVATDQSTTTTAPAATIPVVSTPVDTTLTNGGTTTTIAGSTPANAKDWEVVVGIFKTKALAQTEVDKLTKAKFTGFSIKTTSGQFAVVKAGYSNADATALAAKINHAGTGKATLFHLGSSTTTSTSVDPTAKTWEVVDGIYKTQALAQAEIDKLTKASIAGFTIKTVSPSFAVVKAGLTNSAATVLLAKVKNAGYGATGYLKNLGG